MSLLLDARKKSQQAHSAQSSDSGLSERNPCALKPPAAPVSHSGIRRMFILSGALLAAGTGYLTHTEPAGNPPLIGTPIPRRSAAIAEPRIRNVSAPAIIAANTAVASQPKRLMHVALATEAAPSPHIRIEQQQTVLLDPLLDNAYLAYRNGKPDEAQQLYSEMLAKDTHNTDALLGLAVIAQQRGEEILAARYYARVLTLDPRNATANAGMSALSTDEQNESHLKTLLNEQSDSAALHFALGNHYAGQSRWGEAQQSYFYARTLEPENAGFAFNLAISLDHLGQNILAVRYYRHALQLDRAGVLDQAQIEQRLLELTR